MKVSTTGRISRRHASIIVGDSPKPTSEINASVSDEKARAHAAEAPSTQSDRPGHGSDGAPHGSDRVLEYMKELNLPLTRATYLALAYPAGVPDPLSAEQEAMIPPQLQ
jgi:hypothetical protein